MFADPKSRTFSRIRLQTCEVLRLSLQYAAQWPWFSRAKAQAQRNWNAARHAIFVSCAQSLVAPKWFRGPWSGFVGLGRKPRRPRPPRISPWWWIPCTPGPVPWIFRKSSEVLTHHSRVHGLEGQFLGFGPFQGETERSLTFVGQFIQEVRYTLAFG